ncbi:integrase [Paenibacillus popilliae ATCC 14706]|uniref:Integrase n=1 Tax=Paenibacillus popilliae ATCC 14706 TaxID=1212764 RepID=M9LCW7_PAEPP|nr:integrase [Paenibacillus popilliae ATCC 14706]
MTRDKVRYENCGKFAPEPEYVKTKGLKPTTVNLRLKTLRTMFKFLEEDGVVLKNPFEGIKKVEEDDEGKKILTTEELRILLNTPSRQHYSGFRDITLMCVLIDGFMRISEALSIKKSDIDFNAGKITLRASTTKGRKMRVIPLQKETVRMLRDLIKENEDFDSDLVFLTYYGEGFTERLPAAA